jgi:hypothetical protein
MQATVKGVYLDAAKYDENITVMSIAFNVEGEEKLQYLRLPLVGASEAQITRSQAVLGSLLRQATYSIDVEVNKNGYPEVQVPREVADAGGF